ncbi:MAG: hypothetical protein Q6370_022410 [Candidatus Sigynarchaeota archaeon]
MGAITAVACAAAKTSQQGHSHHRSMHACRASRIACLVDILLMHPIVRSFQE